LHKPRRLTYGNLQEQGMEELTEKQLN
jgi:hypothetical protein